MINLQKTRTVNTFFAKPSLPKIKFFAGHIQFNRQQRIFVFFSHPDLCPTHISIKFNSTDKSSHKLESDELSVSSTTLTNVCQPEKHTILALPDYVDCEQSFTDMSIKITFSIADHCDAIRLGNRWKGFYVNKTAYSNGLASR